MTTIPFPPHKAGLYLTHNEHKSNYETVAQFMDHMGFDSEDCGSPEEYEAIKAGDELWRLAWYPDHPVSSNMVCAATLERVLELAHAA